MTDSHEAGGADVRPLATLDGPAGMTLAAPRYRTLRIVINGPDDSEPPIVIERHDWPVDDNDELDAADVDPECAAAAARVRAAFASARTDSALPDAPAPQAEVSEPESGEAEPADSKRAHSRYQACSQCGRQLRQGDRADKRYCGGACRVAAHRGRRATPVLFTKEPGR